MKKENKVESMCLYCGGIATTRDHVFPRNLYPKGKLPENMMTVPSCLACNASFSKDEEFFRMFISGFSIDWSEEASEVFNTVVARAIKRKPAMATELHSRMKLIDLKSPSGILLGGKATQIDVTQNDWSRCFVVVEKIVRGLLYKRYEIRLPDNYELKTVVGDDNVIKQVQPILIIESPQSFDPITAYAHAISGSIPSSIWVTRFYSKFNFATFVAPKGVLADRPNHLKGSSLNLVNYYKKNP